MSLLHKTSSVLNISKPKSYLDLSINYNNNNNNLYDIKPEINKNNNFNIKEHNIIGINKSSNNIRNISSDKYKYNYNYSNDLEDNIDNNIYSNSIISQEFTFKNNNNEYIQSDINNISINNSEDINYKNERYTKIIDENKLLKEKLIKYDSQRSETNKIILELREENSNLQLKIQKLIENEKAEKDKYRNELNEKNKIINSQEDHIHNIKEKIYLLSNDNISLLQNIQNLNNKLKNLTNDKRILIEEISELNKSLSNKIKPKLLKNEDYLQSLENQIALLKKDNDSLIENDIKQKNIIDKFIKENRILKKNIESYEVYSKDDSSIKEINDIYQKNRNKSITNSDDTIAGFDVKKFSSYKLINKEQKKRNNIFKIEPFIKQKRNSVDKNNIKNIKSFKKLMTSSSEKSINHFKPVNSRNLRKKLLYNFNDDKYNTNFYTTFFIKNKNENNNTKEKNNYLYFNTTIRKKNKDRNGVIKINKNNFNKKNKTRLENISNFDFILDLKKSNNIEEEKKDSNVFSNQINKYNQSQSKSLLSTYTEEIY